jgi:hypothetical protein
MSQRPLPSDPSPARPPWWIRAADLIACLLLVLALVSLITGGGRISLGGFAVSATRPGRLLAEACAILLLRTIVWRGAGAVGRRMLVVVLASFLAGLACDSAPRRVGDAGEYMVMAMSLGRFSGPAVALSDAEAFSRAVWSGDYGFTLASPPLRGRDNRQDFAHFWFYPLLAAPFVRLAHSIGLHPNFGFAALNVLLLLVTTWVLLRRLDVASVLLLVGGPIIWWTDKAHTEVFTFSMLAIGLTLLRDAPWWTMVALGAAATQNPPFVVVLGLTLAWAVAVERRRDVRVWAGAAAGAGLALLHPLYYYSRLGLWSPLRLAVLPHWPGMAELTSVLWDPNLGILVFAPIFTLALIVGVVGLAVRAPARLAAPEIWFAVVLGVFFLFSFTQAGNANSGATFNPSRYGLWLIPLAVPLLAQLSDVWGSDRTWLRVAAALALVWSSLLFQPRFQENYVKPSQFANWLWTRWPSLDNPLPEVFCERVSGRDGEAVLPIATPGCEKVLLAGTVSGEVPWPPQCRPAPVPRECATSGALCYANRSATGYTFVKAPSQRSFSRTLAQSGDR